MEKNVKLTGNKLIAEFMGLTYVTNAKYKNDLYEAGDCAGEWETTDAWILNPSKKFLSKRIFGIFADEDYYNDEKPYDKYYWNVRYDSSWDWLMPVVEKIESLGYYFQINTKMCSVAHDNKGNNDSYLIKAQFGDATKLEKAYSCAIEAIKFINYKNK